MDISLRARALALVSAGAMGASLALAGPAMAQDSPTSAVDALLDAIEQSRFDELTDLVCEAERVAVVEAFDVTAGLGEIPGLDAQAFVDAVTISVDDRDISVLEEGADRALVQLDATVSVRMDETMVREFVTLMLESMGDVAAEEDIESFASMMLAEMETGSSGSTQFDVVREDDRWLVCGDVSAILDGTDEDPGDDVAMSQPSDEESLCGLLSLEELNGIGPLQYAEVDASMPPGCLYTPDFTVADYGLNVGLDTFSDYDSLLQTFGDFMEVEETTAVGYPALWMADMGALYVDTGSGLMSVAVFPGTGDDLAADGGRAYAEAVAEVIVPRFLGSSD